MSISPRVSALLVFALAALFFAAGCDRLDTAAPQVAELDEPGYRRGKELERQGREPEAIIEFNKLLARRGLDNSPETNLELGILNQRMNPPAAIFHFQKYRELRPNSDRDDLVRQRIEAARREFISSLPGRPSSDSAAATAAGGDTVELLNRIQSLQDENRRLRDALGAGGNSDGGGRGGGSGGGGGGAAAAGTIFSSEPPAGASVSVATQSFSLAPAPAAQSQPVRAPPQSPPPQTQQRQLQQPSQTRPQQAPPPRAASRAYAVKKGDSLFSIARQFYGTASNAQVEAIAGANRDVLPAGRNTPLREGMVLKLP